jgi:hypothetical protein
MRADAFLIIHGWLRRLHAIPIATLEVDNSARFIHSIYKML